jgi:CubicO group peptidase (beta-lactamase class C family)
MPDTTWEIPSDDAIAAVLAQRIDVEKSGVGIVVGVADASGRRIVAHGVRRRGSRRCVDADTVFEIGSITKVFTSLLLADMARRGEAALNDPVADYLPAGVTVPERGGRKITLIDLATHTSALPRLPTNMPMADRNDPYADFTVDQLHAFLSGHELTRDIGERHEYSNLGAGLLGHALARRAGVDFETLVRQRITGPLAMTSTAMEPDAAMTARAAAGHSRSRKPVADWHLPTLAGAGALRSTTSDLLSFVEAELGLRASPLAAAMEAQRVPRRPTGTDGTQVALGWVVSQRNGVEVVWHNGGTGGYRAFLGLRFDLGVGVVVLTNAATERGGDDIGVHLLTGAALTPPPVKRQAIKLATKAVQRCVGRYLVDGKDVFEVTRLGARLFAKLHSQAPNEIFPEAPDRFFWKVVDAQASFAFDGDEGPARRVTLRQGGRDHAGDRIED